MVVHALVSWSQQHHTSLHPNVEIYHDQVTGLSFRALRDIPPGTRLVDCSYQTTLSYLNAIDAVPYFQRHSTPFPPHFVNTLKQDDPNVIGHFFLVQQYLLGPASFWFQYIRLLPQPYQPETFGIPVWWPEADRKYLDGTNADPPIKIRKSLWEEEWKRGFSLLKEAFEGWEQYTYFLYQWAATIFGSRSFRPSLTIPESFVRGPDAFAEDMYLDVAHVRKDRFSVLLPVMDIGNHNGANQVVWSQHPEAGQFSLSNLGPVEKGSQIYNYYGDKSNSELLVAYGFTLPDTNKDLVNLRLTPDPESNRLRRSQTSHIVDSNQPEQEFMFQVKLHNATVTNQNGLPELQVFSPGLVDTMSCMVSTSRERRFIIANNTYSLEEAATVFSGPLARNIIHVLRILHDKLLYELARIHKSGEGLKEPQNQNQRTAMDYRTRQMHVLQEAVQPIAARLQALASHCSLCQHPQHRASHLASASAPFRNHIELVSLECAFDWLCAQYPSVSSEILRLIAEDQDEPLPLDWAVLVEDWDHTFWTVWLYIVLTLWISNKTAFKTRHTDLGSWLEHQNLIYNEELAVDPTLDRPHADAAEQETIDTMIQNLTQFSHLATSQGMEKQRLRNLASYVASQECVQLPYRMQDGAQAGQAVDQKLLCVRKRNAGVAGANGQWADWVVSLEEQLLGQIGGG